MSSSFSRSTMEVRQLSFCGLTAARCSSCATTSTTPTGLAVGEAVGAALGLAGVAPEVWRVVVFSAAPPKPSFLENLAEECHKVSLHFEIEDCTTNRLCAKGVPRPTREKALLGSRLTRELSESKDKLRMIPSDEICEVPRLN
jgi:hypothetical protein